MSSNIFGDLANATKALNAHRFGVTTAGTNIANVNNPDYARQRVALGDRGTIQTIVGPRGQGVEVIGFSHARDIVLDREMLRETSIHASLEAEYSALEKAEANTGQEIDRTGDSPFVDGATGLGSGSGGLAEVINDFFNSFHSLAANPASQAEKESLIQKASILTEKFNVTAQRFEDLQADISSVVETDLATANDLIEQIARLNTEIARAEASHAGQALDLRDQRQSRLEALSEIVQIKTANIPDSGGQIRVTIPTTNGTPAEINLVELGRFEQLAFDDSVPGLPTFSTVSDGVQVNVTGGSIHGALKARDGGVQGFITGLDQLAGEMINAINGLYNAGTPPQNTNFFQNRGLPEDITALGMDLETGLDSTTLRTTNDAAQELGDNTLALAIAELDETAITGLGDRTLSGFYRAQISDLGEKTAGVDSRLTDESIVFDLLKQQQDSVSGVSIDEEMTDMMKFQRAFEATGRVVKAIDEMLDVIVNRLI